MNIKKAIEESQSYANEIYYSRHYGLSIALRILDEAHKMHEGNLDIQIAICEAKLKIIDERAKLLEKIKDIA